MYHAPSGKTMITFHGFPGSNSGTRSVKAAEVDWVVTGQESLLSGWPAPSLPGSGHPSEFERLTVDHVLCDKRKVETDISTYNSSHENVLQTCFPS
jgi:hypothetical protein